MSSVLVRIVTVDIAGKKTKTKRKGKKGKSKDKQTDTDKDQASSKKTIVYVTSYLGKHNMY